jgi:hypothetical protein
VIPVAGRSSEASAQPLAGAEQQPAPKESFLTLLWEAGFDLRIDPGATVARALEWLVVIGVSVGSLLLWLVAVRSIDLDQMTDVGLVSVLPAWSYLAFIPIAAAFALILDGPRPSTWLLAAIVVVLVLMLYGAVPFVEGEARFSPSWRHIGVIDYVTRHGGVDPTLDAYHNWPGLFILASAVAGAIGLTDLSGVALWAPVWFNLLYLPALFVLLDSLTDDRRAVWLGIWLFYLTDWIGQDYFSPQAFGFFFFLTTTAVLVRWFAARDVAGGGASFGAGLPLVGRLRERALGVDVQVGVQLAVERVDALEVVRRNLDAGELARRETPRDLLCGRPQRVDGSHAVYAPIGGTRKPSSAGSGASSSISSRGHDGRGTSSPKRFESARGCDVGGTSASSSSEMCPMCSRMPERSRRKPSTSSSARPIRARPAACSTSSRSRAIASENSGASPARWQSRRARPPRKVTPTGARSGTRARRSAGVGVRAFATRRRVVSCVD